MELITIKNKSKIIGKLCLGRNIWDVMETGNQLGEKFYSFMFNATGDGKDWNKPIEVRLKRTPTSKLFEEGEETYSLFVMGLALRTQREITLENIKDIDDMLYQITFVLKTAKDWWEGDRD